MPKVDLKLGNKIRETAWCVYRGKLAIKYHIKEFKTRDKMRDITS